MERTAKLLRKILVAALALTVAFIIFLEIGSRYYKCPATDQSHQEVLVCNSNNFPVSQYKAQIIQKIFESKQKGVEPSRENLDQAINLENHETMDGLNGVACGDGMVFVRDDLSSEAKYFVARHELEHLFRRNGMNSDCSKEEYCATMTAAKTYPIGFVSTIVSSLYLSASESPTIWCFLFGDWSIFREYILP